MPVGRIPDRVGTRFEFHLPYYLEWAREASPDEFDRTLLGGALITLGDALAEHEYFDHAPELELVRHLRNGVAHGNRFNITSGGRDHLTAHNRLAPGTEFELEVTPALNGQEVLWAFIERADVLRLIEGVSLYLIRMGNGDPLRPASGH